MSDGDRLKIAEIKSGLQYIKDKVPPKQYEEMETEGYRKIKNIEEGRSCE